MDARDLHSFPTRRSSDLVNAEMKVGAIEESVTVSGQSPVVDMQSPASQQVLPRRRTLHVDDGRLSGDRKSTRLNSSHPSISYAVFCLKKKKQRPKEFFKK